MKTSVNLQEPFTYSVIPLIIVIVLIIGLSLYFIITRKSKTQKKLEGNIEKVPERNIKDIKQIKAKYIKNLDSIESKYNNQTIELRQAYLLISEAVRMFVFENSKLLFK